MTRLPERPPVVVVDNASADGTADAVAARYPAMRLVRARRNLGAVGRNIGIRHLTTPYVAFCDDDCWWEPGAMTRAADLLDAWPALATVTGRIVVEPGGHTDPIVAELRGSPLPRPPWLPGPALGSILAGASVVRRVAFDEIGGFSARMWPGGEEELFSAVSGTAAASSGLMLPTDHQGPGVPAGFRSAWSGPAHFRSQCIRGSRHTTVVHMPGIVPGTCATATASSRR